MNALAILEIQGWLLVGLGLLQVVPGLAALLYGESPLPWLATAATALAFGLPLVLTTRGGSRRLRMRDGFVVVTASWAVASLLGALPYVATGALAPIDALFESVAGFTTTGSTVMADVEAAPRGLLLWRSLSQWLGGMGIIVFAVAVLPLLGFGGMQLFRAEVPGPTTDKLTPRIAVTARRLWLIYVGFTAAAGLCFWGAGLGPFDALNHALTTLSTGGFSTRNASLGAFEDPRVEWIAILFMLIASLNFVLYYRALTGHFREVSRDAELRFYLLLTAGLCGLVFWSLRGSGGGEGALRAAVFQVVSLLTTTGYGTADYAAWPALAQLLLLHTLALGGMAGSTSGAVKAMRILLGLRILRAFVSQATDPHAVQSVRYAGRAVAQDVVSGIGVFFMAYFAIVLLAALCVSAAGYDLETALSAGLTAMGNVGPGLGAIGPTHDFAHFPAYVKLTLAGCMIAGRLEVFTVIVLLEPRFWRR